MAAAVVFQPAPRKTTIANYSGLESVISTPLKRLSFAASNVAGERIASSPELQVRRSRTGGELERRSPVIVSPKAVSDSQNSQTCLNPDASSVINFICFKLFFLSVDFTSKCVWLYRLTDSCVHQSLYFRSICFHLHVTGCVWIYYTFL